MCQPSPIDASINDLTQSSISPVKADAHIAASWELLQDTSLSDQLARLLGDARDILEGTAFAVGTGSTQPRCIVAALDLVTSSRTSATTSEIIGAVDVFNVSSNLPARFNLPTSSWMVHRAIANKLRALATGPSQAQWAFWADFSQALPPRLIGYDIRLASAMASTQTVSAHVLRSGLAFGAACSAVDAHHEQHDQARGQQLQAAVAEHNVFGSATLAGVDEQSVAQHSEHETGRWRVRTRLAPLTRAPARTPTGTTPSSRPPTRPIADGGERMGCTHRASRGAPLRPDRGAPAPPRACQAP